MQVLVALASQPGEVVTRETLLAKVWAGTYSGEVSLTRCVSQLRSIFSDERTNPQFIETIPKTGYRLIAPVQPIANDGARERSTPMFWIAGTIAVLVVGFGYLAFDRLVLDSVEPEISATSIAVLPFVNLSDEPGNEYFSDGISEEILGLLLTVPDLRVTSRTSAFSFKGQNVDIPTIAAKLNVAYVLEGSVRKSGMQLRITAQLVEAEIDRQLWSDTFDRELEDVFAIQDEIAAAVVDALKIRLLGEKPDSPDTDPQAYALYLQARYLLPINQYPVDSLIEAETLLKQALEIDADFAPAWRELADVYSAQAMRSDVRPLDEAHKLARDAIQRALEIDPHDGRTHAMQGDLLDLHYTWDFTTASRHMQRAMALNPGDAYVLAMACHLEFVLGRLDKAIDLCRQWVAVDPLSPHAHVLLGGTYYRAHRLDEAEDSVRLGLSMMPSSFSGHYLLGAVLLAQGDAPAALAAMEQERTGYLRLLGISMAQHALANATASDRALQELIDDYAPAAAYMVAAAYAFRGEIDNAFDWLGRAYEYRDPALPFMLTQPELANLHADPRWGRFLDKMGLPH